MSVPATKAAPPAPRIVTTRTLRSAARRSTWPTSCSYIDHVIALRASGRSKTIAATAPSRCSRTAPSSAIPAERARELGALRAADAELREHLVGVLAQQRRMAAHLLRRRRHLDRKADVRNGAFDRVVDVDPHPARAAVLAVERLRVRENRAGGDAGAEQQVDPVLAGLRAER